MRTRIEQAQTNYQDALEAERTAIEAVKLAVELQDHATQELWRARVELLDAFREMNT